MIPATFEVTKKEVHALRYCQCSACTNERARLMTADDNPAPAHVQLSPQTAKVFGLIPTLNPHGSLAREYAQTGGGMVQAEMSMNCPVPV